MLFFLFRKYQIEIRRALAIATTPPTTPPAIAPLCEEDEEEPLGSGDGLNDMEGPVDTMLIEGDEDNVALSEAALEAEEDEVVGATMVVQQRDKIQ